MSAFGQWLLHEDRKELFDSLYAAALSVVFFGLTALVLWPLGALPFAWRLAKGYWVFCVALGWTALALYLFRRVFHVDLDTRFDAYVISALVVSSFVQAGWCAFAALAAREWAAAATWPVAAAVALFGFLSCYVSSAIGRRLLQRADLQVLQHPFRVRLVRPLRALARRGALPLRLVLRVVPGGVKFCKGTSGVRRARRRCGRTGHRIV